MKRIILIFSLFITFCISATEIKSELQLLPNAREYREGDIVEIDLKIWPIENADLEEFRKIESISLFGALEVTQISSVETSENNADVVLIKAIAVVTKAPETISANILYKGNTINIMAPSYKFLPLSSKNEDYFIMEQKSLSSSIMWVLLFGAVLIGAGTYLYLKKFRVKKDDGLKSKRLYQELFSNAEERKDFENIYATRKHWAPLIIAETNAHREFYKLMEQHQYKKEWSLDVRNEIKLSFDIIRGSFS